MISITVVMMITVKHHHHDDDDDHDAIMMIGDGNGPPRERTRCHTLEKRWEAKD
jgi:hypothetical protein